MTLKVGDQVVRVDGYSRGVVLAVVEDTEGLNPFHQVAIRQRDISNTVRGDTIVTRDIDGYSTGKYEKYRFVKKPETKTVTKYYLHYAYKSGGGVFTMIFDGTLMRDEEARRLELRGEHSDVRVVKLSEETFKYEVPEKK